MNCVKDNTTAVILAGGRGTRMGGVDKGLVEFQGKPLIEHVLSVLKPQVETILINANRSQAQYGSYGLPVVEDQFQDFPGPLAGMEAALSATQTPYLLTVPCDTPRLPTNLLSRMGDTMQQTDSDLVVADDGDRMHPVCCLMKQSLLESLRQQLTLKEYKIDLWFPKIRYAKCDFSDCKDAFVNINRMEELQSL